MRERLTDQGIAAGLGVIAAARSGELAAAGLDRRSGRESCPRGRVRRAANGRPAPAVSSPPQARRRNTSRSASGRSSADCSSLSTWFQRSGCIRSAGQLAIQPRFGRLPLAHHGDSPVRSLRCIVVTPKYMRLLSPHGELNSELTRGARTSGKGRGRRPEGCGDVVRVREVSGVRRRQSTGDRQGRIRSGRRAGRTDSAAGCCR